METFSFVGLGNPGDKYVNTLHNSGFKVVDLFKENYIPEAKWKKLQNFLFIRKEIKDKVVFILKPLTYMNLSGKAVKNFTTYFNIDLKKLVVIHDDIDLNFGRIKLYWDGGAAGHKGILSIIENLGTQDFYRLRIGIGPKPMGVDMVEYVLKEVRMDFKKIYEQSLDLAVKALYYFMTFGAEKTMNYFNQKNLITNFERRNEFETI